MAEPREISVLDNPSKHRYELFLDGERAGVILYRIEDGVMKLVHTEIVPELEGQGMGARLLAAALADIRARGLRIVPLCPFVAAYLKRHPQDADLIAKATTR